MYYVIRSGEVLAAARFPEPGPSGWKWLPGQIIHFETQAGDLSPLLDDAFLVAATGVAWHVEILEIQPLPIAIRQARPAADEIVVRLRRKLHAAEPALSLIDRYRRLSPAGVPQKLGAA